jgi:hypothetical protein
MMMIGVRDFAELVQIEQARKLVEMKHRLVLAVITVKRDVFAEIHIFQVIRNIAAVTALHALAEFFYYFFTVFRHIVIVYETKKKCKQPVFAISDFRFQISNFRSNVIDLLEGREKRHFFRKL